VEAWRLCQRQDKRAEARQLLTEVYGWFTEGFDTADLTGVESIHTAHGAEATQYRTLDRDRES
jgi:hypothetical protein